MSHNRIPRTEVLYYALVGLTTIRGTSTGLTNEEWEEMDRDIEELERRLAEAEAKNEAQHPT